MKTVKECEDLIIKEVEWMVESYPKETSNTLRGLVARLKEAREREGKCGICGGPHDGGVHAGEDYG
jgi:hypothetical protein